MSELAIDTYKGFIKEAFIDPIKSVLIIDDDYPTQDEQLFMGKYLSENEANGSDEQTRKKYLNKGWRKAPNQYENIILRFRQKNWLVDTHDGHGISFRGNGEITNHLHQSDLLILDYQLEGEALGGEKCISALQQLASNKHFNLVVVHTKKNIADTFHEILPSLLNRSQEIIAKGHGVSVLDTEIQEWEDDDCDIIEKLISSIDLGLFFIAHRNLNAARREAIKDTGGRFSAFAEIYRNKPEDTGINISDLFYWVITKKQERLSSQFLNHERSSQTTWSAGASGQNWIRTDRLFVTIASKSETSDLPDILLDALHSWNPLPPRLILTKLRSELEDIGVSCEDQFLSNIPLQAGWYQGLLSAKENELSTKTTAIISTYWDGLSSQLHSRVTNYAKNIVHLDIKHEASTDERIEQQFQFNIANQEKKQESLLHQNAYSCSKDPAGWHLTTGHIFELDEQLWVCLSPACDLVPLQKVRPNLNKYRPFKAVMLHPRTNKKRALEEANSNTNIFVTINDDVKVFSLLSSTNISAIPDSEEMLANDDCPISDDGNSKTIQLHRLEWCEVTQSIITKPYTAKIVAQLRYEYALNLLQRLGSSLSRIGLDFVALENKKKNA
tara:strand:- start:1295 stop:3133 length:1839 start_codon:yes stop_codon:yes gene_type:complete